MGKFHLWLQERIKPWIKPATPALISSLLSDLTRSRTDLVVENALLRQQLIVLNRQIKRPQLSNPDRFCLVLLSHFTKFWKQSIHIVQPDTLLRWHRELFRIDWRRKSQGKPNVSSETITLIRKMAGENQLWGAERIRGELLKLGIEVSKRTIQKHMLQERESPSSSQTWATFLKNQASAMWACDFTVVRIIFSSMMVNIYSGWSRNIRDTSIRNDLIKVLVSKFPTSMICQSQSQSAGTSHPRQSLADYIIVIPVQLI